MQIQRITKPDSNPHFGLRLRKTTGIAEEMIPRLRKEIEGIDSADLIVDLEIGPSDNRYLCFDFRNPDEVGALSVMGAGNERLDNPITIGKIVKPIREFFYNAFGEGKEEFFRHLRKPKRHLYQFSKPRKKPPTIGDGYLSYN